MQAADWSVGRSVVHLIGQVLQRWGGGGGEGRGRERRFSLLDPLGTNNGSRFSIALQCTGLKLRIGPLLALDSSFIYEFVCRGLLKVVPSTVVLAIYIKPLGTWFRFSYVI